MKVCCRDLQDNFRDVTRVGCRFSVPVELLFWVIITDLKNYILLIFFLQYVYATAMRLSLLLV